MNNLNENEILLLKREWQELEKVEEYIIDKIIQESDGSYGDCHIPAGFVWGEDKIDNKTNYEKAQKRITAIKFRLAALESNKSI